MLVETQKNLINHVKNKIQVISHKEGSTFLVGPIKLPVQLGDETVLFKWYCWLDVQKEEEMDLEELISALPQANLANRQQSSVLVYGDFEKANEAVIRMHSICHTGDIFGSKRCDCGFQLTQSMKMISETGAGAIFYLANHEGRGIGLFSKALTYLLQEEGLDTVEANEHLGFEDDTRSYDEAIRVLKKLRQLPVKLITNNPNKLHALQNSGANISDRVPLWGDISSYNQSYLETKIEKAGHFRGGYPIERT